MSDDKNIKEIQIEDQNIIENIELNIWEALIPVLALVGLLAYNIFFSDGELLGEYSNQYILLIGGGVAAIVGFFNKVGVKRMMTEIWENWKSIFIPVMILFLVGALAGTWLVSGVIPAMVYYGLQ
ncbi:MAG: sodium:proton antiporter, partial [Flavobacteriaceae bacterium]|nr:sodium:proton antiporter [Flavobacteriaceae bacterium]